MIRKRIEAWAWFTAGGIRISDNFYSSEDEARRHTPFMHLSNAHQLIRFIEHSATAEAVVRAAVKFVKDGQAHEWKETSSEHLEDVVVRHFKKGKKP